MAKKTKQTDKVTDKTEKLWAQFGRLSRQRQELAFALEKTAQEMQKIIVEIEKTRSDNAK